MDHLFPITILILLLSLNTQTNVDEKPLPSYHSYNINQIIVVVPEEGRYTVSYVLYHGDILRKWEWRKTDEVGCNDNDDINMDDDLEWQYSSLGPITTLT